MGKAGYHYSRQSSLSDPFSFMLYPTSSCAHKMQKDCGYLSKKEWCPYAYFRPKSIRFFSQDIVKWEEKTAKSCICHCEILTWCNSTASAVLHRSFIAGADLEISQGYQGRNKEEESRKNKTGSSFGARGQHLLGLLQWWIQACLNSPSLPPRRQVIAKGEQVWFLPAPARLLPPPFLLHPAIPWDGGCSSIHKVSLSCTGVERLTSQVIQLYIIQSQLWLNHYHLKSSSCLGFINTRKMLLLL